MPTPEDELRHLISSKNDDLFAHSIRRVPYISQLRAEGIAEGEARGVARGVARAIVKILKSRGICMTTAEQDQILGCADLPTLDRWLDRVWAIATIGELFADETGEQILG
jgi:hypothetical protein